MVLYRRNRVPDGIFFFTVTLRNRHSDALVRNVDVLRESWRVAKARVAHEVIAVVVLPEHLHAVVRMCDGAGNYPRLLQEIKKGFTRRIPSSRSPWQSRYWEHTIRNDLALRRHIDYVHINPVKHGLVMRVADWPYSSFHRYVRNGWLPADWAGESEDRGVFGEPQPA